MIPEWLADQRARTELEAEKVPIGGEAVRLRRSAVDRRRDGMTEDRKVLLAYFRAPGDIYNAAYKVDGRHKDPLERALQHIEKLRRMARDATINNPVPTRLDQ